MTPYLLNMIRNKPGYIDTLPLEQGHSRAAHGAFHPTGMGIWCCGYFQA